MAGERGRPDPQSDVMLSDVMLSVVAPTRAGESVTAILLTLNVFLLLCSYYLLKVAREPLILLGGGAEVKSYAAAGQAGLLILVSYAYGAIARTVNRVRLITIVILFFVTNLVAFSALAAAHVPIGVPFYLWVGCFSLTVIAQFWAFAADIYDEERGKRMFPILGIGSSVGAVGGSALAHFAVPLGPPALLLLSAAILIFCVALTIAVHRRELHRGKRAAEAEKPIGGESGFKLLLRDKYLLLIGVFIVVYNSVNTTGEYVLDRTLLAAVSGEASPEQFVGNFKAEYFAWVNAIGVVLQTLVVSRVIKYLGVRGALFIMPLVSLFSYGMMAVAPVLSLIFVAKIAENSLDYSLNNTSRQALWLVTTRDAKYKAKQVIDTFLQRAGDVTSAGLVAVGAAVGLGTKGFALANVGAVLAWLGTMVLLTREHKKREGQVTA
ncbi:MAG TPA: Npt1/Npt2 family nucleotide transporter [Haliangiales bacterium]|nr:Npt1/Npt2 family nucleotide transporter [Haliangiales bacterium]